MAVRNADGSTRANEASRTANKVPTSVVFTYEQIDKMDAVAEVLGTTRSALIRLIVEDW